MEELISGLSKIPLDSQVANFHGTLAMFSLIFFGASFVLYRFTSKISDSIKWFKVNLTALFVDLLLLDIIGLFIYIPYRATGGSKSILIASKETAWLHEIIFEHKEFLAFGPVLLVLAALLIVIKLGDSFGNDQKYHYLRLAVISALIISLIFVLTVAGEAVLVTKVAPI